MLPFVGWLVSVATKTVKDNDADSDDQRLKFIGAGVRTPELATVELQKEAANFGKVVAKMSGFTRKLVNSTEGKVQSKMIKKIKKYEEITDSMEIEITEYITKLADQEITTRTSAKLRSVLNACNDLERVGDIYFQVSKTIEQKIENKHYFTPDQRNNINLMMDKVDEAFVEMSTNLDNPHYDKIDISKAKQIEVEINGLRNDLRKHNLKRLGDADYNVNSAMIYNNLFSSLERIGDHIMNVNEAISGEI